MRNDTPTREEGRETSYRILAKKVRGEDRIRKNGSRKPGKTVWEAIAKGMRKALAETYPRGIMKGKKKPAAQGPESGRSRDRRKMNWEKVAEKPGLGPLTHIGKKKFRSREELTGASRKKRNWESARKTMAGVGDETGDQR